MFNLEMLLYLLGFLLILLVLLLFLGKTTKPTMSVSAFKGRAFAHRGLHTGKEISENSNHAFLHAIEKGYGIELDIQHTKDNQLVVFHDKNLQRMCNNSNNIYELTYAELMEYPLPNGEKIPLFKDVLTLINGKTPIIIEVKYYDNVILNTALALELLKNYSGDYCIKSFHPKCVQYLKNNAPQILRGQLALSTYNKNTNNITNFAFKHLLVNFIGRPHFISYEESGDFPLTVKIIKKCFSPLFALWTIRDEKTFLEVQNKADMFIFEGFEPKKSHCNK